jgi:hypothetical protein
MKKEITLVHSRELLNHVLRPRRQPLNNHFSFNENTFLTGKYILFNIFSIRIFLHVKSESSRLAYSRIPAPEQRIDVHIWPTK